MSKSIKLGVSGDKGSFSEEAALRYAKINNINVNLEYLIDMEGVLSAVENDDINMGIFPVVNMNGGLVRMAYDAMGNHHFNVIDELWLDVHQCLLVKPGVVLKQIKNIVTHKQAILQCTQYINKHLKNAVCREWQDTAKAARELSLGQFDETTAVIAPKQAARVYGLHVIAEDIQDRNPNLTAFIIVNKRGVMELTINQLRQTIDKLDEEIIQKLAQRKVVSLKIGDLKSKTGDNIRDKKRENELMLRYENFCNKYDLQQDYIKNIFKMIIANSRELQK